MRATHLGLISVLGTLGIGCIAGSEVAPPGPAGIVGTVEVVELSTDQTTSTSSDTEVVALPPSAVAVPAAAELTPLETDFCDDATYESEPYSSKTYENLVFRYVDGTAAATDLDSIAAVRLGLQSQISEFLDVTSRAPITITLSPTRMAAVKHGYGKGVAYASSSQIEALYLGGPYSYERVAPGHELTHIVASRVDGAAARMPLIDEGLAEYFDGSGRDLHAAYANELRAGWDAVSSVTRFNNYDVWGDSYGRAGSFVKFLIERFGRAKFIDFWKASAITYSGSGYVTKLGDTVTDGVSLEKAVDHATRTVYGVGFDAVRLEWEAALSKVLDGPMAALSAEDRAAIDDLIAHLDDAVTRHDSLRFRATMDGFYCDWQDDDARALIARSAVESRGKVQTTIIAAIPVGTRNYTQVALHAVRRETRDGSETLNAVRYWVERFPVGFRITSATSW